MATRAVIYARLSQAKKSNVLEQEQSDSIENQIAAGEALAAREGYELVDTYVDDGRSGFKKVARPGFSRLLSDMSSDRFDLVLVRHHDRLHRNDEEDYLWRAACVRHGIRWQTFSGAITDPATAEGAFTAKLLAAVGQLESQVRRDRQLMMNARKRADGDLLPQGFGWRKGGIRDPEQAEHVVWMFKHLAAGGSLGAIVRRMNDLAVPQKRTGKKWQHGTIVSIIRNPRVAGLVLDEEGRVIPNVRGRWDALIEPELFYAAQAARQARRPAAGPTNNFSTRHLLGGIAECGVCGLPLRSNGSADPGSDGTRSGTYRCTYNRHSEKDGRRHVSARVADLDELARRAIVAAFTYGPKNLLPATDEGVREQLNRVHRQLADLHEAKADLLASRTDETLGLTMADIAPELRRIQTQVIHLDEERQSLRQRSAAASMLVDLRAGLFLPGERASFDNAAEVQSRLRERLDAMHIERQRDLVRHLLSVRVLPGRGRSKYEIEHRVVTSLNLPT